MKPFDKLKTKLAELFQLDQADLDFGIYRIMNAKREEITRFLEKDLLPQVQAAFQQYRSSDKVEIHKELSQLIENVKAAGLDPEQSPKVKELRTALAEGAIDIAALENEVYDHLYSFFSRYYDEGDFISMRRYKEGVYAIPYEGEEVKLHWANHDQYYIKTTENFRDYTFKLSDDKRVHFKIVEADTEKDNVKASNGKDRRFIIHGDNPVPEENGELIIHFEYRPDPEKRKQDDLNRETATTILTAKGIEPLWVTGLTQLWRRADGTVSEKTILQKHLYDYTRRNTFDYFIHKDLGRFLHRELDFYIKNEVMHLDDVENESTPRVEQYLSKIKVIRKIAHKIIDFLAQIEEFQKKLWLKKKFVVDTNYCVTLDRVPEELYPEIAKNDTQREEWIRLFAIHEIKADLAGQVACSNPLKVEFLKANPYLVLDTKFFDQKFKDRLLAGFGDVVQQIDGVLIHGDNFHALSLMAAGYRNCIQCIHIDPPYNTQTSGFLYKNNYQHSSWLAMMESRITVSIQLLAKDGSYQCHIDENEYEVLHQLFERTSIPSAGTLVWDKKNPMLGRKGVATQHEYLIWRSSHDGPIYRKNTNVRMILTKAKEIIQKHGGVTEKAKREYARWISAYEGLTGGDRAYRLLEDDERVYRGVAMGAPEPRTDPKFHIPLIHPVTKKPCPVPPNGWSRSPETLQDLIGRNEILFGSDETTQPQRKVYLEEDSQRQMSSVIQETGRGKGDLDALGLAFPYCHPVSLYEELLGAGLPGRNDTVLDFFVGSGTSGHAVINLNREDDGNRKYILVEMGDYFDTVLKPRIQKVVYANDWKDGKPVCRNTGVSHMFKYLRLESYEDALANLQLHRTPAQQSLLDQSDSFRESYMLSYMLDMETKDSSSLLNIDRFDDPFSYQLLIGTGSVGETKPDTVDLIETFNWLLGLKVKHIDYIEGFRIVEGVNPKVEKALVIWRKIRDLAETDADKVQESRKKANEDLEAFFRKQQYNTMDMEFDVIYVNGDNNLMNLPMAPEGEGLVPRYKVRLIEEEFKRLMFDVKDV
jgi:adenine-specific DNA-methyltransferase